MSPRVLVAVLTIAFATLTACADTPGSSEEQKGAEKKGGWRLASEESDYLAEHSKNPVEWHPWGEEAFAKAKKLKRPIFLSIGYNSCHWCHVMRRESFSDDEIAKYMNEHFINIKVDREELPHVDALYMGAVQRMTGRGGWPLSVWLTPEQVPFIGGTYFPPREKFGRPGFLQILNQINDLWNTRRDEVVQQGNRILADIQQRQQFRGSAPERSAFLAQGVSSLKQRYDAINGGFGQAPKFPAPRSITLLSTWALLEGSEELKKLPLHTLRQWAKGGINDQVGGGFHRYSVDAQWSVPHFEKMLYNQGLNIEAYLDVARLTGAQDLEVEARRTLDALLRDFGLADGSFASSWDADSEEEEGTFFLWTVEQVTAAVGEDAPLLCAYLGITPEGNFEGTPRTVPYRAKTLEQLRQQFKLPRDSVQLRIDAGLKRLFQVRAQRIPPHKDNKVILGWNALAISALAKASVQLGDHRYLEAAQNAHAFCMKHFITEVGFQRRYADGSVEYPGTLPDAAYFLKATVDLYEASFDPTHVATAVKLFQRIVKDYGDKGADADTPSGFFEVRAGEEILVGRPKRFSDGAIPSGNATLARTLIRLHALTGDAMYRQHAEAIVNEALQVLGEFPAASPETMLAVLELSQPYAEVAVVGDLRNPLTRALLEPARRGAFPFRVVAHRPLGLAGEKAALAVPLLRERTSMHKRPTAYLCVNFTCQAPTNDPAKLKAELELLWQPKK